MIVNAKEILLLQNNDALKIAYTVFSTSSYPRNSETVHIMIFHTPKSGLNLPAEKDACRRSPRQRPFKIPAPHPLLHYLRIP
jgi:hypothetical protein